LNASDFYKDKHFGCALEFVFVNPSDSEFPLCKENLEGAHLLWQISSFSRHFLETLTETGSIHWVGVQT